MLEHLTDEQLLLYHQLYERMNSSSKRLDSVKRHSYDVKFAYHIVRLALECEQILTEGDLDLERNSEVLKAIRRGEWTLERMQGWFSDKEVHLENAKDRSTLPNVPNTAAIQGLLMECLEHHYGSLDKAVHRQTNVDDLLREMQAVIDRHAR